MSNFITSAVAGVSRHKLSVSSVLAAVGGYIACFLGGCDSLLITLVTLIVIDYVTGVAAAIYRHELSSEQGFKGIIKKILIMCIVGLSVALQGLLPAEIPLREITILFFVANEGFSILENASTVIPLPQKLKSVLRQIQFQSESLSAAVPDSQSEQGGTAEVSGQKPGKITTAQPDPATTEPVSDTAQPDPVTTEPVSDAAQPDPGAREQKD